MEIRKNEDGSIDEIVGNGKFHLEQMDNDLWCLILEDSRRTVAFDIYNLGGQCVRVGEAWREEHDKSRDS